MITLNSQEVGEILTMPVAIELIHKAMILVANGGATLPLRNAIDLGAPNMLGIMPGAISEPACFGTKLISLYPDNPAKGYSSHLGLMVLFERDHGTPIAMMNAGKLTAIRTAAASAVATRALARTNATTLAIIGTGEQAWHHLAAMHTIRNISELRIVGRTLAGATDFATKARLEYPRLSVIPTIDTAKAVKGADIICTVTSSRIPILEGHWVDEGCHINAVGASIPTMREIDQEMVTRSRLFVDYRPSALNQAGDIISAIKEGVITEAHIIADIGDVLQSRIVGRQTESDITLYRSLGIAAQDLICAHHVMEQAQKNGVGTEISI